jgi:hypothetical protein
MKLPVKDCSINDFFKDAKHPNVERLKYCKMNCGFCCKKGLDYKKKIV